MATWDFGPIEPQEDAYQHPWWTSEDDEWGLDDLDNIGWDEELLSSQQSQQPRLSRTTSISQGQSHSSSTVNESLNTLDQAPSHAILGAVPHSRELLLNPAIQLSPPPHLDRRQAAPSSNRDSHQQVATSRPPPIHREDWLDQNTGHHPNHIGYFPGGLFERLYDDAPTPTNRLSTTPLSEAADDFLTLEDSDDAIEAADMAPATRRHNRLRRSSNVVDLTSGTSPPDNTQQQPRGSKRPVENSTGGRARKRGKLEEEEEDIEEIDLANDEAPSAEEELLQQQRKEAIRSQQAAEEDGAPQRIGKRQCIICMENYTNATATACGHFYCHECLTQALLAGEKNSDRGIGSCPVCRKPLKRNNKKTYDVIPITFMKKSQFAKNQSKRTDISSQRSRDY